MQNIKKSGSKKILFICGSMNQTTMMHRISSHLTDFKLFFTPYYADGFVNLLVKNKLLDWTILAGHWRQDAFDYMEENDLHIDYYGNSYNYDLVLTCSDLVVPKNIRNKKLLLVQEGMTNPRNFGFYLVKYFKFPGYVGDTAAFGMSDLYDRFCVASEGYKELFVRNGLNPDKIVVTGIPNYDDCRKYYQNDFPYRNFVMVATSDSRETFIYENRKKFIQKAVNIAAGRQMIFKLHPNENFVRATREIKEWAPEGTLVYSEGNAHEMIANCDVLVTRWSTLVYTGIALGKEVYSEFEMEELRKMSAVRNSGTSSWNISQVSRELLEDTSPKITRKEYRKEKIALFRQKALRKLAERRRKVSY